MGGWVVISVKGVLTFMLSPGGFDILVKGKRFK